MMHGYKTWAGVGVVFILGIYSIVTGFTNVGILLMAGGVVGVGIGHKLDKIIDQISKLEK